MKKILILIMVFMAVATVYGREITGKVVGENDTPLDYVNVVLYRDSTNGTSQSLSQHLSQSNEEKIVEFCKESRSEQRYRPIADLKMSRVSGNVGLCNLWHRLVKFLSGQPI